MRVESCVSVMNYDHYYSLNDILVMATEQAPQEEVTNDRVIYVEKPKDDDEPHKEERSERLILPKFNGNDFSVWKAQVEAYLSYKDKWFVIQKGKPRRILKGTRSEILQRNKEITSYEIADGFVRTTL